MICEACGHEFGASLCEVHELSNTSIIIGCPVCSEPHTYHRNEGDC